MENRNYIKDKKRIVIKIGSSSLVHEETGHLNLTRMEKLVRIIVDLENSGKEVVLVSSGAIPVGSKTVGLSKKPLDKVGKQACAAVGQARLMMVYQKLFSEYNSIAAQILMTKNTMVQKESRHNAHNTFCELFKMGVVPIVNENDTVSTDEIEFGDNDTLSAVVAALINADLLILLSDIDGLYTDNPRENSNARFIETVGEITEDILNMGKGAGSDVGTGGMSTKISAARIATDSGADMIIANAGNIGVITDIMNGERIGTLFKAHKNKNFHLIDYLTKNNGKITDKATES